MQLSAFIIASMALSIQYYADQFREDDLEMTLDELAPDRSLPVIKTFDFVIGKCYLNSIWFSISL